MANIGIMEGAYFVGRVELLNWINEFLSLDYKKVEQACSGVAYCQLMDALYPGQVPLHKVNFGAKFDYEYIKNFGVLQEVFVKLGIDKKVDIPSLVKGKLQDNLEFMQWMKKFFDLHYNGEPYDAVAKRTAAQKGAGDTKAPKKATTPTKTAAKAATKPAATKATTVIAATKTTGAPKPATKTATPPKATGAVAVKAPKESPTGTTAKAPQAVKAPPAAAPKVAAKDATAASNQKAADMTKQLTVMSQQLQEYKSVALDMETERDFYFKKLQKIESICQENADSEISQQILAVMAADDETEAAVPQPEVTDEAQDGTTTDEVEPQAAEEVENVEVPEEPVEEVPEVEPEAETSPEPEDETF
jgi:RP/EB family microtubule-associated protein